VRVLREGSERGDARIQIDVRSLGGIEEGIVDGQQTSLSRVPDLVDGRAHDEAEGERRHTRGQPARSPPGAEDRSDRVRDLGGQIAVRHEQLDVVAKVGRDELQRNVGGHGRKHAPARVGPASTGHL
jgi:hypothetical protein